MKIESKVGTSAYSSKTIYDFITDFRNFDRLIPEENIKDWKAEREICSFSVDMIGNVSLIQVEKEENSLLKIATDPGLTQYNFKVWIQLKEVGPEDTRIKVTLEPLVSQMILMMVKSQLKGLADALIEKIETFDFSSGQAAS